LAISILAFGSRLNIDTLSVRFSCETHAFFMVVGSCVGLYFGGRGGYVTFAMYIRRAALLTSCKRYALRLLGDTSRWTVGSLFTGQRRAYHPAD